MDPDGLVSIQPSQPKQAILRTGFDFNVFFGGFKLRFLTTTENKNEANFRFKVISLLQCPKQVLLKIARRYRSLI